MDTNKRTARLAGSLYLAFGLMTAFGLVYVPSHIVVAGDASATARSIVERETFFRASVTLNVIGQIGFSFVAWTLYRLLKDVNKNQASLMMILWMASVPIAVLSELGSVAAVMLAHGSGYLGALSRPQLNAMAMLFLQLRNQGMNLAQIFWGLWLFPLGVLFIRSGFMPRIIGALLMLACGGYAFASLTVLFAPAYGHMAFQIAATLGGLGEGSTILWLLIWGIKTRPALSAA